MSEFPSNSFPNPGKDEEAPPEKQVEQVTAEAAKTRKKPLGKRFKTLFFGSDAKTTGNYIIFEVLIPAAKDTIVEAAASGVERLIYGEGRRRRGGYTPPSGPSGYENYQRYAAQRGGNTAPRISRRARAVHNFDEIILNTQVEANEVLEQLLELGSTYSVVSVADLYRSVGLASTHVDTKWGWTDLREASVAKIRGGGWLLDLPEPTPL